MSAAMRGGLFAAVAGIMAFISLDELLPAPREYGEHHFDLRVSLGHGPDGCEPVADDVANDARGRMERAPSHVRGTIRSAC